MSAYPLRVAWKMKRSRPTIIITILIISCLRRSLRLELLPPPAFMNCSNALFAPILCTLQSIRSVSIFLGQSCTDVYRFIHANDPYTYTLERPHIHYTLAYIRPTPSQKLSWFAKRELINSNGFFGEKF